MLDVLRATRPRRPATSSRCSSRVEAVDLLQLRVHLVAGAGVDDHQRPRRAPHQQRPHRHVDRVALVGRRALLPQRLRHDAEHRAAVEPEVAVEQRRESRSPELSLEHARAAASARPARRARSTGWMKATSEPCAPSRGVSSISRTPLSLRRASAARMSATRSVRWWMPGPRFATYFAIGESSAVASSSSMRRLARRNEMRAHALRRHLLGRLDLEAQRVAIERERPAPGRRPRCRRDRGSADRPREAGPAGPADRRSLMMSSTTVYGIGLARGDRDRAVAANSPSRQHVVARRAGRSGAPAAP